MSGKNVCYWVCAIILFVWLLLPVLLGVLLLFLEGVNL